MTTIGFIKLHRKIIEWEWYSDANTFRLFTHLLLSAKFKDENWRGIEIKRGQIICGRIELAKSTGLTEQQVRTALGRLKSTSEITIKTTSKFSIITLTNYAIYQDDTRENNQQDNQQNNQRITSNQPAINQQSTTDKEIQEVKERKEDKNYSLETEELTDGLKFVLEAKLNRKLSSKSWKEEIRKLLEIDLKERRDAVGDVKRAIQEIANRFGEQYFPVIQSAASLREKFSKVEAAIERNKSSKTQSNKQIFNNLANKYENE